MRPGPVLATLALGVLAAAAVHARPIRLAHPGLGDDGARAPRAAAPARLVPGAADGFCGTAPEGLAELAGAHAARALAAPLPTPNSADIGEIAVLEDDGNFFYTHNTGYPKVDLMAVSRAFYRTHGDDYDFLAIFLAGGREDWLGSPTAFAASFVVRNPTQGLGLPVFDEGAAFGSPARLQDILSMNGLHKYDDDPDAYIPAVGLSGVQTLGHEAGHRWTSYVGVDSLGTVTPALLGRDYAHWGFFFDSDASVMEGCDWAALPGDSFVTVGASTAFGRLDQYLMGLRSAAEIDSLLKIDDPHDMNPPGDYKPWSIPAPGIGGDGRATWWTMADVIAANGPRVPDAAAAPHVFRMAVVLVVPRGTTATAAELARLEAIRARYSSWFAEQTEGRGATDLTLVKQAGRVTIAHAPLPDREDASSPVAIGARVAIAQAGIPLAVDPGSVSVRWRPAGGGAWNTAPMSSAGADSFAATLPGAFGIHEYYLYASSDSAGIDATHPAAGAAAPHVFRLGADLIPPAVVHVPVRGQGAFRMPQTLLARATDGVGVDSVWIEYRVDEGPLQSAPVAAAGRDSYAVALGTGLAQGQRIVYRFAARDRSVAGNVGYSRAAFDTLAVVRDGVEDFENGAGGWLHLRWTWSYRDPWHTAIDSTALARGTGFFAGEDGAPYPPHADGVLVSPFLVGVPPGTVLRFDHRYDLEERDATHAWDAALIEGQTNYGDWMPLTPVSGYTHALTAKVATVPAGTPCWSGTAGWRTETVDLTPLAPGPVRVRFRFLSDEFLSREGWRVDQVRILWPTTPDAAPGGPAVASRLWPNPARDELRLAPAPGLAGAADWALHDVAGRRVATLWRGALAPGATLAGRVPETLAPGLYFARLRVAGREADVRRVTVVR